MEEKLIVAVENHSVIYNKSLPNYKSANDRDHAWKKVAEEMNLPDSDIESLKKRWRTLRDAFIKHYRASKHDKSGSGGWKRRRWIYYNQMLFLIPFIECKEAIGSYPQNESQEFKSEEPKGYDSEKVLNTHNRESTQETHVVQIENEVGLATSRSFRGTKRQSLVEHRQLGKPYTKNKIKHSSSNTTNEKLMEIITKKNDPDEQFMSSCVPILKQLTPKNNFIARMQIQKLLFNLAYGGNNNCDTRPSTSSVSTMICSPQPSSPSFEFLPSNENSSSFMSPKHEPAHTDINDLEQTTS